MGEKKGFCPYFYAKEVRKDVELVLMPYGYILDRTIANSFLDEV